jgi:hypothetical protein
MPAKLYIGSYTEEEIKDILAGDGHVRYYEFDGSLYHATSTSPYCLGESDAILYHLAGFLTIVQKQRTHYDRIGAVVLKNVTERMDEDNPLSSYISKMKKCGKDVYIFSSDNAVSRHLYLSVKTIVPRNNE